MLTMATHHRTKQKTTVVQTCELCGWDLGAIDNSVEKARGVIPPEPLSVHLLASRKLQILPRSFPLLPQGSPQLLSLCLQQQFGQSFGQGGVCLQSSYRPAASFGSASCYQLQYVL